MVYKSGDIVKSNSNHKWHDTGYPSDTWHNVKEGDSFKIISIDTNRDHIMVELYSFEGEFNVLMNFVQFENAFGIKGIRKEKLNKLMNESR